MAPAKKRASSTSLKKPGNIKPISMGPNPMSSTRRYYTNEEAKLIGRALLFICHKQPEKRWRAKPHSRILWSQVAHLTSIKRTPTALRRKFPRFIPGYKDDTEGADWWYEAQQLANAQNNFEDEFGAKYAQLQLQAQTSTIRAPVQSHAPIGNQEAGDDQRLTRSQKLKSRGIGENRAQLQPSSSKPQIGTLCEQVRMPQVAEKNAVEMKCKPQSATSRSPWFNGAGRVKFEKKEPPSTSALACQNSVQTRKEQGSSASSMPTPPKMDDELRDNIGGIAKWGKKIAADFADKQHLSPQQASVPSANGKGGGAVENHYYNCHTYHLHFHFGDSESSDASSTRPTPLTS